MAAHDSSQCELIDQLAEEFAARYRHGERPSLQEYLEKYPELAGDIRQLFPALVEMEQIKEHCAEAAPPAAAESPPLRQVGDYRILRVVGRGGMGVVYEAEQVSLGRRVALKALSPHIASDHQSLERFRREARSAAKLHHTNIVPVFDVGEDGDTFYYAMQFIQGQSLDQIVAELRRLRERSPLHGGAPSSPTNETQLADAPRREVDQLALSMLTGHFQIDREAVTANTASPLAAASSAVLPGQTDLSSVRTDRPHYFQSVARIAWQTAHALAYAHARGIIHRDIKPSNLLLDTAGVVWITDFGLAKTQDNSLTTTGDVVGTLRYMAPERIKGEGDERADVYALGLTLYEMLALRPAFDARDRLQLIDEIKNREPLRPRLLDRRIPRDLETIVLKAIHKEPKGRYQTAEEMAEDLRRFLADEPIKAKRTSQFARLRLWSRRHPALALLLLLLLLTAAASTLTALYLRATLMRVEEAELQGEHKMWLSYLRQAQARRMSRQTGQRFGSLHAIREALALPVPPGHSLDELRTEAIAALVLPDFQTLRSWEALPGGTQAWDADDRLRRYVRADPDGGISLRWIDSDEEIARLEGWKHEFWLQFSPGGRFLLAYDSVRFRIWDLSAVQPRLVHEDEKHGLAFHPDDRHLLVSRRDGSIVLYDLQAPQQKPAFQFAHPPPLLYRFVFDPSGDRLAAIVPGKMPILDPKTGKVLASLPETQSVQTLAWHPSGNYLALVCSEREIHVWDLKRMTLMTVLKGCRSGGVLLNFTPDGERLLSNGWEGMVRLWDWRTGRQVLQQPGGTNLRCLADGRLLIAEGGRLHMAELATGKEYRSFRHQSNGDKDVEYWAIQIHPEGRLVAVTMSDCVRLFDLNSGEELASLPQNGFGLRFQGKEALLTNATAGLFRWPVQQDKAAPNRWRLGPPHRLHGSIRRHIDSDRKGEIIGQAAVSGAMLIRPNKERLFLRPHYDVRSFAISPDGKYASTGNHWGDEGIKVWDTETGRMLVRFPLGGMTWALFSPDGQWLLARGSRGSRMVKVGSWEERPLDPWAYEAAFSPDSSLFAAGVHSGIIRLLRPDTGEELARLSDPNQDGVKSLTFTADGSKLLVSSDEGRCIHVWDLRAIRTQLAELGLDWDLPPLPAAPPGADASPLAAPPLQVQIELGDFRQTAEAAALVRQAAQHIRANKHADGLAELRKAVRIAPRFALAHNNLAWELLTGPKASRDPEQALVEARQAVALEEDHSTFQNTLGVALYRVGRFAEAVPVLERSLREGKERTDAFDLFFLAMCHHRLGDAAKAKDYRQRGAAWFAKHKGQLTVPGWFEELTLFQAETDAVLAQPPGQEKK